MRLCVFVRACVRMHACACVQEMIAPGKSGGREMSCCFRSETFKMPVTVAQTQVHQTAEAQSLSFFLAALCACPHALCVCFWVAHVNSNSSHGWTSHELCQYKKAWPHGTNRPLSCVNWKRCLCRIKITTFWYCLYRGMYVNGQWILQRQLSYTFNCSTFSLSYNCGFFNVRIRLLLVWNHATMCTIGLRFVSLCIIVQFK
jgi:hypothetical protein